MKYVNLRCRSSSPFSKWHRFVHGVQFYLVNTGLLKSAAKHEGCYYAKTSSLFSQVAYCARSTTGLLTLSTNTRIEV